MKVKASIVVMSHLNDAKIELNFSTEKEKITAGFRIDFVKFLIKKYPDLSVEIDPDEEYNIFIGE